MPDPKTRFVLILAAGLPLGAISAHPLTAQQTGRMQVVATVVDVSASLDVLHELQLGARPAGSSLAPGMVKLRSIRFQPDSGRVRAASKARARKPTVVVFFY